MQYEFKDLFNQIKTGKFIPLSDEVFESLEWDGWMDEKNDNNRKHYRMLELSIPQQDSMDLIQLDDEIVNKYNEFDIELKSRLGDNFLDLINYDEGKIFIVRYTHLVNEEIDKGILDSFKLKDKLHPKFWNENKELNSKVKDVLTQIANDFYETLEITIPIEDILFVGSLANYNWSKYSDIDLHIVMDFEKIANTMDAKGYYEPNQFVKNYFDSKKQIWNDTHKIKIFGYDVELYAQDTKETLKSNGIFSIKNNEWVKVPSIESFSIDYNQIKRKAEGFMNEIDSLEKQNNVQSKVDKLKDKIKKLRKSGLESGGEFSTENLVFKTLRRNGYIEKLYKIKVVDYDKQMSLKETNENNVVWQHLNKDFQMKIIDRIYEKNPGLSLSKEDFNGYMGNGFMDLPHFTDFTEIDWVKWFDGEIKRMMDESTTLNESKTYQAKLKDGRVIKKQANRDFNAVYVDVYDNGEHVVKGWSSNNGKLNELKKEANRYNNKRINQLNKLFPKYKLSKIVDTYVIKPKLIKE